MAHRILGKLAVVPAGPQECGVGPKMAASLMKISVDVHGGVSTVDKCEFRACGNILRRVTLDDTRAPYNVGLHIKHRVFALSTPTVFCAPRTWLIARLPRSQSRDVATRTNSQPVSHVLSQVEPAAASFFSQLGRRIYVSPKSYLDFLRTFLNMLGERRRALSTRLARQVILVTILCWRRVAHPGQHQIVAYLRG